MKKILIIATIVSVAAVGVWFGQKRTAFPAPSSSPNPAPASPASAGVLAPPLPDWQQRITKKPFGIYVSPGNSPVSPERFTGYHTGTDFEILAGEENADVAVAAACSGKVLREETARGYGGLLAQSCTINGQPVTVYYGHIRIASVTKNTGEILSAGEKFAVLGVGYSAETGGERKHLHLGIHKGTTIDSRGYVQNKAELDNWLDAQQLLI